MAKRTHPVLVQVSVTPQQREQFKRLARASKMTMTEWARRVLVAAGPVTVREVVEVRRG